MNVANIINVLGVAVPAGTDPERVSWIPGTFSKFEWTTWETRPVPGRAAEKREGIAVHMEGWNKPFRWTVKKNADGSWANCDATRALDRFVDLGLASAESVRRGEFDFDSVIGRRVFLEDFKPYRNLDYSIRLPVAMAEDIPESPGAGNSEERIMVILRETGPISEKNLKRHLIEKNEEGLLNQWFEGLKEKVLANGVTVEGSGDSAKLVVSAKSS